MPADILYLDPVVKQHPTNTNVFVGAPRHGMTRELLVARDSLLGPPPVALCATPPAQVPPTKIAFSRGPGAVGIYTTDATNYCDSFHSWGGIGVFVLRGGITSRNLCPDILSLPFHPGRFHRLCRVSKFFRRAAHNCGR